ncbi:MAG TPA: hypothetical protein VFE78_04285 [Gemmataceae bacterium]|jgi:hypothetical protein|nr:hypothetical protein [Gemmataceae bacterium]
MPAVIYWTCLWGQSLLALAALGLAGGWALWPFRRPDRPYLWLAAPLAGVPVVGVGLTLAYHACGLPVPLALLLTLALSAAATLVGLVRWARRSANAPGWKAAAVALAAASAWATFACNRTALGAGEPTVALCEGSDQWGYSTTANWMLRHPNQLPAYQLDRPSEAYTYSMLGRGDVRPGAFLISAAAALVRGTTAIFSFDWACGVLLGAGIAGLAGLFAARRTGLLLLLAAGALSTWLTLSRTGYFGKLLAYPAFPLLSFVFVAVWARPSVPRLATAMLLSLGVGFCLDPIATPYVLALTLGGMVCALAVERRCGPGGAGPDAGPAARPFWRAAATGALVFALLTAPPLVIQAYLFFPEVVPAPPLEWSRLVAIVLDVDNPGLALVGVSRGLTLAAAALLLDGVFLALALRQRNPAAVTYLLSVGLILVAWLWGVKAVYAFQGVLFPLSAVGAVLVLQHPQAEASPARRLRVAALVVGLLALRAPQFGQACARYLDTSPAGPCACFRQSEVASMLRIVGGRTVDVRVDYYHGAMLAWDELGCRGVRVQYREPSWSRLLGAAWAPPAYEAGDFLLCDRGAGPAGGRLRFAAPGVDLVDTRCVTLTELRPAHGLERDPRGLFFWQGRAPSTIQAWNGTGRPVPALLTADCVAGPSNSDPSRRTVRATSGGRVLTQVLGPQNGWRLSLPVVLPPGNHSLTLAVEEPATVALPTDPRDLLLMVVNVRLEERPVGPGSPSPTQTGECE